jgi:hypothetical protein
MARDSNIYGADANDFAMSIASDALTPKASNETTRDQADADHQGSRGNHFNTADAPGGKYRELEGDQEKINAGEVTYSKKVEYTHNQPDSRESTKSKGN